MVLKSNQIYEKHCFLQVKAAGAGGEGMEKLGLEKLRSQVGVAEQKKGETNHSS